MNCTKHQFVRPNNNTNRDEQKDDDDGVGAEGLVDYGCIIEASQIFNQKVTSKELE